MALSVFSHEHFMREALKEARAAFKEDEIPVGAVVVCHNQVVARAHNQVERLHDATAHAEMLALTAAMHHLGAKYLKDCTLYVTLEPCLMCAAASAWAQVEKVIYGAGDPKQGYARVEPSFVQTGPSGLRRAKGRVLHPKTKVITGVLEKECAELMVEFFAGKRRQ